MKSKILQARHVGTTGRKVVMALALASALSGLSMSSALADENDDYGRGDRQGDHSQRGARHGDHGQRGEWRGNREGYGYRSDYRQPYIYAQPVYVPPAVYYEPRQSPGISLFFPLDLRW
jgi:hypothetical protein